MELVCTNDYIIKIVYPSIGATPMHEGTRLLSSGGAMNMFFVGIMAAFLAMIVIIFVLKRA